MFLASPCVQPPTPHNSAERRKLRCRFRFLIGTARPEPECNRAVFVNGMLTNPPTRNGFCL
jgi:hypothetical protein